LLLSYSPKAFCDVLTNGAKHDNKVELIVREGPLTCGDTGKVVIKEYVNTYLIAAHNHDTLLLAIGLNELAIKNYKEGNFQSALEELLLSEKTFKKKNELSQLARIYYNLGIVYLEFEDYNKAVWYLLKSDDIEKKVNDSELKMVLPIALGDVYLLQKKYDKALDKYFNFLNTESLIPGRVRYKVLIKIGSVYKEKNQLESAKDYYNKAQKEYIEAGAYIEQAVCYSSIAEIFLLENNLNDALDNFNKSNEIYLVCSQKQYTIENFNKIAQIHIKLNNYNEAVNTCNSAMEISKELGLTNHPPTLNNLLGDIYLKNSDFGNSLKSYNESLKIAKKINALNLIKDNYDDLANLYNILNEYGKAYEYEKLSKLANENLVKNTKIEKNKKVKHEQQIKHIEKKIKTQALFKESPQQENINLKKGDRSLFWIIISLITLIVGSFALYLINKRREYHLEKKKEKILQSKIDYEKQSPVILKQGKEVKYSFFPSIDKVKRLLPRSFIYYKPSENQINDFYWLNEYENKVYLAIIESEGKSISGTYLSHVTNNILQTTLNDRKIYSPSEILNNLNINISYKFREKFGDKKLDDFINVSICCFDFTNNILQYSGAYNPIFLVRDDLIQELYVEDLNIFSKLEEAGNKFTTQEVQLLEGDIIYLSTNGILKQLDYHGNEKLGKDRFKNLLKTLQEDTIATHEDKMKNFVQKWKGNRLQKKDFLVIGIKI
jgi:tetratricopeptide (TPR) repeat protein